MHIYKIPSTQRRIHILIKSGGLTKASKKLAENLIKFDKQIETRMRRVAQNARQDVLNSQLFTGPVLTDGKRPQGQKDSAYNRLFGYSVKPFKKTQSIRATLGFKNADESGDFIKSGRGTYLNKLTSTTSYKANSETSIRIASERSAGHKAFLTKKGKRLKKRIHKGKNVFITNPSKNPLRFNKKWQDVDATIIFKRRKVDNKLVPLGKVLDQGTYKGKDYEKYKFKEIHRVGKRYFGDKGVFDRWLRKEWHNLRK